MGEARFKVLRKWFKGKKVKEAQPPLPHEPSLNDKMLRYIEQNQHRQPGPREGVLRPEILIPCYNHGAFIGNLVDVLQDVNVPVTVIDDNSNAETREIIDNLQRKHGLKVIRNAVNLRQAGSLNKAIAESENNLFSVANADDYLLPAWVSYALGKFGETDISLLGGKHICFFNHFPQSEKHMAQTLRQSNYQPQSGFRMHGPDDARHFSHDNSIDMTMTGCTFLKSAWEFVGGFYNLENRVSIHDDRDFQMRVCAFFKIGVSDELSAFWRSDSSTGMGTK